MKLSELGEFGLIDKIKGIFSATDEKVVKSIGDDCAVVESYDYKAMLLTTDVMVEGVHFKREYIDPVKLGRKAMAVNISDIAAMGGKPLYAFITLASPESMDVVYIENMLSGINSISREFGIEVIGGDTSLSPDRLIINIFLIGEALKDNVLYRSGAGPVEVVFVAGELGSSAAGLDILNRGIKSEKYNLLINVHNSPYPQIKEGNIIASSGLASSLIDISDGLISDLRHICAESNIGAVIRENDLPISEDCRRYCEDFGLDATEFAFYGGEDYVLLGTVPEHSYYKLRDIMKADGCQFIPIGKTREKPGISVQNGNGNIIDVKIDGYDHFKNRWK